MRAVKTSWFKYFGLIVLGIAIGVALPGSPQSAAKEVKRVDPPRIGYVNIAKVLREYNSANKAGAKITRLRENYVEKVKGDREILATIEAQHRAADDDERKKALKEQASIVQKRIDDTDKEAQAKVTELSNKTIVVVYEQIRDVLAELAKDRGLDVVEVFPAASRPEDEKSPQIAQLMLQTPALIPYYIKPDFDFTDAAIEMLNKKHPPDAGGVPANACIELVNKKSLPAWDNNKANDVIEWEGTSVRLPIEYNPARKEQISKLRLFVSQDRGRTWNMTAECGPEERYLTFTASKAGVHWFALQIVGKDGRGEPKDSALVANVKIRFKESAALGARDDFSRKIPPARP